MLNKEEIEQLEKSLSAYKKSLVKAATVQQLINRHGDVGRNGHRGEWQNSYSNKLQIALQYTEGGNSYWSESALDEAFNKSISRNFDFLLQETLDYIEAEFSEARKQFEKYKVISDENDQA